MFNIGIGEILFIAILALVFIGPERLPKIMRQIGVWLYQIRLITHEFTSQYSEELRPLREFRDLADGLNPAKQFGSLLDPNAPPNQQNQTGSEQSQDPMSQITSAGGVEQTIAPPGLDEASATAAATATAANPMSQIAASMQEQTGSANQELPVAETNTTEEAAETPAPVSSPMDQIASAMKSVAPAPAEETSASSPPTDETSECSS
ncbi:MAG: hypothetical protein GY759_22845 [Chloroflexi bacterium]|nr:hypothetical protein [Chloroflexota bacterium]